MVLNVYKTKILAWLLIVLIKGIDSFVISTGYVSSCQSGFCTSIENCPLQNRITNGNERDPQQYVKCLLNEGDAFGVCCLEDPSDRILYRTHRDRRAIQGHDNRRRRQTDPNTEAEAANSNTYNNTTVDAVPAVVGPALISKYGPVITFPPPPSSPEVKNGSSPTPVVVATTNDNNYNQSYNTPVEAIQPSTDDNLNVTKMAYPIEKISKPYVPLQRNFTKQKQYQQSQQQQLTGRASSADNSVSYPQQQQQQRYPSNKPFSSRSKSTYSEPSLKNRPSNIPYRKFKLDSHSIPDQAKNYNQHQQMGISSYNYYKSNYGDAPPSRMSTYYQSQPEKDDVKNKGKSQNGNNRQLYAADSTKNKKTSNHYDDYKTNYDIAPQSRMSTQYQSQSESYNNNDHNKNPSTNLNKGESQSLNNRRFENVYSTKNSKMSNQDQRYQKPSKAFKVYTQDGPRKNNPQNNYYHKLQQSTKQSSPSYYLQKSSKYENVQPQQKSSSNVNSGNYYQKDYHYEPSYSGRSTSKVDTPSKYTVQSFKKSQNLQNSVPTNYKSTQNQPRAFSTKIYNSNKNDKMTSSSPMKQAQILSFRSPIQSNEPPQQYQFTTSSVSSGMAGQQQQQPSNRERQRKRRKTNIYYY